jgi:hypothetical protein
VAAGAVGGEAGRFLSIQVSDRLRLRICAILLMTLMALSLASCTAQQAAPAEPLAAFQPFLGRSLSYLARQVDTTGFLHAAAGEGVPQYWLAPDNMLALWAFDTAHAPEAAAKLRTALRGLPPARHGLIEAMQGAAIPWPPHTAVQQEVQSGIWEETYNGGEVIANWESDCFLDLVGALQAWNAGDRGEAQRRYTQALGRFDQVGCLQPQSPGRYLTRDLALRIFAGARIGVPVDKSLIDALLALQAPSGGFTAEYTVAGPTGATTTAATAYAALALMAVRQE